MPTSESQWVKLLALAPALQAGVHARFDRQREETKSLRREARSTAKTAVRPAANVRPSVRLHPCFLRVAELSAEGNNSILALLFAGAAAAGP